MKTELYRKGATGGAASSLTPQPPNTFALFAFFISEFVAGMSNFCHTIFICVCNCFLGIVKFVSLYVVYSKGIIGCSLSSYISQVN